MTPSEQSIKIEITAQTPDSELAKLISADTLKSIRTLAKQLCDGNQHGERYHHMLRATVAMGVAMHVEQFAATHAQNVEQKVWISDEQIVEEVISRKIKDDYERQGFFSGAQWMRSQSAAPITEDKQILPSFPRQNESFMDFGRRAFGFDKNESSEDTNQNNKS